MGAAVDVGSLSRTELETLVVGLLGDVAGLRQLVVIELREEIPLLNVLKGRPDIKPRSGMEAGSSAKPKPAAKRLGRGPSAPRVPVEPMVIKLADQPEGACNSRISSILALQDIVLHATVTRYRRERWVDADSNTLVEPLLAGIDQHFGPQLRRYVRHLYYQGQVTVERLVAQLQALGVGISKRHVARPLNAGPRREPGGAGSRLAECRLRVA